METSSTPCLLFKLAETSHFTNMGRTKQDKKVKDPNKPKRPQSAYFFFVGKERAEAKKRGEDISRVAEWTKAISGKWRELSATGRKQFDESAAKDKARYEKEMANYKGPGAKRPKDANKPKRPQSAYFLFLADFREKERNNFKHDGGHKDLIRAAGEKWNKLSATEKQPYEKKAMVEKEKYEAAMAEYTAGGPAKKAKANNGAAQDVEDDDDEDDEEEEDESD